MRRYNLKVWKEFCNTFNQMPVVARIDEKILCMHGGLSPDLKNPDEILSQKRGEIPESGT
jgi:serine/threonine-protein phosphatase PP1 catalytic subunit